MSLTRAQVLTALREYGQPVTPVGLASLMHRSPGRISSLLSLLYFKDLIERLPHPAYRARFVYRAKGLQS
jgi:hypothetical protein